MENAVSCGGVVIFRGKILLLYKNYHNRYTFNIPHDIVEKEVHWYLMTSDSYFSRPQREEFFTHSGYYRYIEAYHLLKFPNERNMLEKAYKLYLKMEKSKNKKR